MTDLFDRYSVIDVDTHLTEPPDAWTARTPARLHDQVPHIERIDGRDTWMAGGERLGAPGFYSMAGWDGVMPVSIPNTFDDIDPARRNKLVQPIKRERESGILTNPPIRDSRQRSACF